MEIKIKPHTRIVHYVVDAGAARTLRNQGKTLVEIRAALAPMVSLATISRALARTEESSAAKS